MIYLPVGGESSIAWEIMTAQPVGERVRVNRRYHVFSLPLKTQGRVAQFKVDQLFIRLSMVRGSALNNSSKSLWDRLTPLLSSIFSCINCPLAESDVSESSSVLPHVIPENHFPLAPADTVAASTNGLFAVSPPGTRKRRTLCGLRCAARERRFKRKTQSLAGTLCV